MFSIYKFCLTCGICLLPITLQATEYELITISASLDAADIPSTINIKEPDSSDNIKNLQELFANQRPVSDVPVNQYFDIWEEKNANNLTLISHPDIAVKFFNICRDELNGYVTISFSKTHGIHTTLSCLTKDSYKTGTWWEYAAKQQYGNNHCPKFEGIISNISKPYNPKYGPILYVQDTNVYIDGTDYYRATCQIQFPTPIPDGNEIIPITDTTPFNTTKSICEQNSGTFVIDDYTATGKSTPYSPDHLRRYGYCIFTQDGAVEEQIANSYWEYRKIMNEYKGKLGSGKKFKPDNNSGKRCQRIFGKKSLGDNVVYLGQAIPVDAGNGNYSACQFSIINETSETIFQSTK